MILRAVVLLLRLRARAQRVAVLLVSGPCVGADRDRVLALVADRDLAVLGLRGADRPVGTADAARGRKGADENRRDQACEDGSSILALHAPPPGHELSSGG